MRSSYKWPIYSTGDDSALGPKLSTDVNNFEMSTNPDSDSDRTREIDKKLRNILYFHC